MSVPRKDSISTEDAKRKKKKRNFSANSRKYLLILQWLPKYNQFQAISDVIAGITIGLTMIPQSIAYAALAGLTAQVSLLSHFYRGKGERECEFDYSVNSQYGLYSSFLGGFIYLLLGTTKEVSIGPTSLMSLLTMEYTHDMPIDFVVLLTFLAGCVELTMGLLNLGFLVDFISIPVTSAFTSAAAIIIIVAQIQGLLGLRYKSYNIIDTMNKTFKNIEKVHLPDVALSFSCIVFLLLFRKLQDFGNKTGNKEITRTKKILWFLSIGRNALVVLITSIISFNLTLQESSPFTLSGKVKPGLPAVSVPPFSSQIGNRTYTFFDMCSHYGSGIFMIPIIGVLTNVAIAKVFASGNSLNAKQEMLTLGICNILGSFFSSMPTCGALTRSAVSAASGIQTPMAGLYTGKDAIAAIVTFVVCIVCNIEVGLLLGAALNIIFLLHPSARPNLSTIECKHTYIPTYLRTTRARTHTHTIHTSYIHIYISPSQTDLGNEYLILKPDTGFYYPAVDFLSNKLETIATKYEEQVPLLVDCERFQGFDYTAIKSMERLSKQLNTKTQRLWLLNVKPEVIKTISILADNKYFLFINDHKSIKSFVDEVKKNTDEQNLVDEENQLMKNTEKENLEMEGYEDSNGIFKKRNDDMKESDKVSLH
uniref:sodium-independent sulfate anion transporter-like isoform X4 n=1 Tax=Vespula vulgaris TaxID=7454 RepID=UPI00223A7F6B|nr:sodium-independent sulfate anion transporter-like isoform X4 [Vespula vulgaris]